ncbi:MAG: hypothetical protein GY810_32645 [Aureispira sp.]|nr:hypothetical protein [Aureispira sp.]
MKGMKNFLNLSLFVALVAVFTVACNNAEKTDKAESTDAVENKDAEAAEFQTRSLKAVAAEYSYKSMATFQKGKSLNDVDLNVLSDLEGKKVNLVVLYDSEAPWAEVFGTGDVSKTGDDTFNGLLDSYELAITKQFELDDMNEGLVLEPNEGLVSPVEAAREISMVDYILMVHVKEVPADNPNVDETASTD